MPLGLYPISGAPISGLAAPSAILPPPPTGGGGGFLGEYEPLPESYRKRRRLEQERDDEEALMLGLPE